MINSNDKSNKTTHSQRLPEKIVYDLLCVVFISGGYSSIVLDQTLRTVPATQKPYITRLFYGCLEKNVQFDYIIAQITDKKPKKPITILLKIGLYLLRYTQTPAYAAIDKTVELAKSAGKSALSGFINAVLRRSLTVEIPDNDLSVNLSYPRWIIDRLKKRYDDGFIKKILSEGNTQTHIRRNSNKISLTEFEKKLSKFTKSPLGYWADPVQISNLSTDEYTVQSLSSMLAVHAYLSDSAVFDHPKPVKDSLNETVKALDLCAAPGGKAVYLKELRPEMSVTACDIHPHRLELIKKYAARMGATLNCELNDAIIYKKEWAEAFDLVVCDVPCSGLGVKSKPDILINRKEEDIKELAALQFAILNTAAKYVKYGGALCYSTCTLLREENEEIIENFLKNNKEFVLEPIINKQITDKSIQNPEINFKENNGMLNLYPQDYDSDGFFIAKLTKLCTGIKSKNL